MNICLKHQQSYPLGSYCPYCGAPPMGMATGNSDGIVWWPPTAPECPACENPDSSVGHTCSLKGKLVYRA